MNFKKESGGIGLILSLFFFIPLLGAVENRTVSDVLKSPALQFDNAEHSVIIDITRAGNRMVAVGERGIVLISDDNGKRWRQVIVPVSVTLTAAQFVSADVGWAVGHSGVVMATQDGGENWILQLNGIEAAEIERKAAQTLLNSNENSEDAQLRYAEAERLVAEGPDKPFLDLHFIDEHQGLVVGAYGLALKTFDGGKTWNSAMGEIDNHTKVHLYAVSHRQNQWIIAGEMGYLAQSSDQGKTFQALESPYGGSFFTAQLNNSGTMYIGGLQGNGFVSMDGGLNFNRISSPAASSFNDSVLLTDGRILLASMAGRLFLERIKNTGEFAELDRPPKGTVIAVEEGIDNTLITSGFTGITSLKLSSGASED